MKKFLFASALLIALAAAGVRTAPGTLTPDERKFAIDYYQKDHFITHPVFGTMDLYQGLVLLAAHSARHTLQIEEVMASPGFPKK